jgi:hypothetical protein
VNTTPDPEEAARLVALARQGQDYALHMMRTTGSVPPTVIADTDEGLIFCTPSSLADEAAKDRFADVARLLAVAYNARALLMVVEAWVRMATPDGTLDTTIRPSLAPDKREMVVLMMEDRSRCANTFLPIIRDGCGAFAEFGAIPVPDFTSAAGRFAGLMPKFTPNAEQVTAAKAALLKLGMHVVNRGVDPSLN